jgi:spore coat protein U-like protein
MEVSAACVISASDLHFGVYNAFAATGAFGQTSIQLQCTPGLVAEVGVDAGTAPGASATNRQMVSLSGADRLDYSLYVDSGRRIPWGDTTGVDTLEIATTGVRQEVPVYGLIPAGQRVEAGVYGDEVTVRVLY